MKPDTRNLASQKAALPPAPWCVGGKLLARGDHHQRINYHRDDMVEARAASIQEAMEYCSDDWSPGSLSRLADVDVVEAIGAQFSIHRLCWRTYSAPTSAPNLRNTEDYLFLVPSKA